MTFFSRFVFWSLVWSCLTYFNPILALTSDNHLRPTANFRLETPILFLNEEISFDASNSQDAAGNTQLDFRWKFGQESYTTWTKQSTIKHIFTEKGATLITLQVRDQNGLTDEAQKEIYLQVKSDIFNPLGRFFVDPLSGTLDTTFHFRVEASSFLKTPPELIEVRFDYDGDGTFETAWSTARDFFHNYSEIGTITPVLEIRDGEQTTLERGYYVSGEEDDSQRNKAIGRILITKSGLPKANLEVSKTEILPNSLVSFDATKSQNADFFRFDFNADGIFETAFTETAKVNHVFQTPGLFEVILEVKNLANEFAHDTATIVVLDQTNIAPIPNFTLRNQTNPNLAADLGIILDEFSFSASSSKDPDGSDQKIQVRWDFEGDGIFDTSFSTTKLAKHRFYRPGNFQPQLEVLDESGLRATQSQNLKIVINTPPKAELTVTPLTGTPQTKFYFDASDSYDEQSTTNNLEFRFDFENDGIFDTDFSSTKTAWKKFSTPGFKQAKVEVRDHAQLIGSKIVQFEIFLPEEPQAILKVEPSVGTFATNFQFDASASLAATPQEKLKFQWDFNYTGLNDLKRDTGLSTYSKASRRFQEVGQKTVCVFVQNSLAVESQTCRQFLVHPASPALEYLSQKQILRNERIEEPITRGEISQLIMLARKLRSNSPWQQLFTDVPRSYKFSQAVQIVAERNWLKIGTNFTFNPASPVKQRAALKLLISGLYPKVAKFEPEYASYFSAADPEARFLSTAQKEGLLIFPHGQFDAEHFVTRAEVAQITAKLMWRYADELFARD